MERLTIRVADDISRLKCRVEEGACIGKPYTCPDATPGCPENMRALNRLAAYEDTGLTPEEVKAKCAWADNVCKMLSGIFEDSGVFDFSHIKELITAEQEGRLVVLPCKVGDTVYDIYNQDPMKVKQICIKKDRIYIFAIGNNHGGNYAVGDFGNRIFLTRAEAEKAMEVSEA